MPDKILDSGTEGNIEEIIKNSVDPAFKHDPKNPNESKYLSWTLFKNEQGLDYWQATGHDGRVYIVEQENPIIRLGKVTIKEPIKAHKGEHVDIAPKKEKKI